MSTQRKSRDYQNRKRWNRIQRRKRYRRNAGLRALVLGLEVVAAIALALIVIKCVGMIRQTSSENPDVLMAEGNTGNQTQPGVPAESIDGTGNSESGSANGGEKTGGSADPSASDPSGSDSSSPDPSASETSSPDPLASETETESGTDQGIPVRELDPDKPMVAFTFDDGPNPDVTNRILDAMEEVGGRVTFFVMGNRVSKFPKVLTRAYEMGCEIGNHSFDHPQFSKISDEDIRWQIEHTNDLINEIIPTKADVVRVPYGDFGGNVMTAVEYPMIQWNVDTLDWKTKNKDMILAEIRKEVSDGDIILMHDLYTTTADAFVEIVPELVEQGYQFVTVRELIEAKGKTLDNGVIYYFAN